MKTDSDSGMIYENQIIHDDYGNNLQAAVETYDSAGVQQQCSSTTRIERNRNEDCIIEENPCHSHSTHDSVIVDDTKDAELLSENDNQLPALEDKKQRASGLDTLMSAVATMPSSHANEEEEATSRVTKDPSVCAIENVIESMENLRAVSTLNFIGFRIKFRID
jgi:hypothetical protein